MRIVTWNINSVRLRIALLDKLIQICNPDIICLQETKTEDKNFPHKAITEMGYPHIVFSGEKSYNGVAIISRVQLSDSFSLSLYNQDKRHICTRFGDIELHNFYVPAGGDEPDIEVNPKYLHKLEYVKEIKKWFAVNRSKKDKIILLGDLNIAPHEHDVWSSKQLCNVISHTQPEKKVLLDLQNSFDFIDTGRHFIDSNEKLYSWWSYRNKDWKKSNRGRRLDHIWVSKTLSGQLISTEYVAGARDWEKPSDHIPVIIDIENHSQRYCSLMVAFLHLPIILYSACSLFWLKHQAN